MTATDWPPLVGLLLRNGLLAVGLLLRNGLLAVGLLLRNGLPVTE